MKINLEYKKNSPNTSFLCDLKPGDIFRFGRGEPDSQYIYMGEDAAYRSDQPIYIVWHIDSGTVHTWNCSMATCSVVKVGEVVEFNLVVKEV